jgi:phenol 2-monooxygenase
MISFNSISAIASRSSGTILLIPRERNLTRLYIQLPVSKRQATEQFVMDTARTIMQPFKIEWKSVEWFGVYQGAP